MAIVVRRQFGLPVFLENLPVFHEKTGSKAPAARASRGVLALKVCRLASTERGSED